MNGMACQRKIFRLLDLPEHKTGGFRELSDTA